MEPKLNVREISDDISKNQVARWLINSVENYQLIKEALAMGRAGSFVDLTGMGNDRPGRRPAIVTGSGPTLEMCMPYMKEIVKKHDPIILCGMSNIGIYLREGIRPHAMCVYDARDVPSDERFGLDTVKEELKGMPLVTHPECDPRMLDFWINELESPVYFFLRGTLDRSDDIYTHYLMGFLPQIYVVNPFMPRPLKDGIFNIGCVANIEMVVANQMGVNPIYLVGVNLGYPDGKLHANPMKKTGDGWEGTGYEQGNATGKEYFEADNGVLTDRINILYKLALLTVWAQMDTDVVEVGADGKYGILDLLPKVDVKDLPASKHVPMKERARIVKEYYASHGYTVDDFNRIDKVADTLVEEKTEEKSGQPES